MEEAYTGDLKPGMTKTTNDEKTLTKKQIAAQKSRAITAAARKTAIYEAKHTVTTAFTLISSAATLVAALAWNNLFTKIFAEQIFPQFKEFGELFGMLIYAFVVTVVAAIFINRLKKAQDKLDKVTEK